MRQAFSIVLGNQVFNARHAPSVSQIPQNRLPTDHGERLLTSVEHVKKHHHAETAKRVDE
jgi:hypothetical protein